MGVAADDRHPGLGDAQLRSDDVDDAAAVRAQRVQGHAELLAVRLQRLDLLARQLVGDHPGDGRVVGRDVVVGRRQGPVRAAHLAALQAEAVEGLRRGHLVDEVQVDVDQVVGDLVSLPDLVEHRLWGHRLLLVSRLSVQLRLSPAAITARSSAGSAPGLWRLWGRSASKVALSPPASEWISPSTVSSTAPLRTTTVSRLPGSWIGGSAAPPVEAPAAEPMPGDVGALARQRRCQLLDLVPGPGAPPAGAAADDHDVAVLVDAQQLREGQLEAVGDPRRDGEGRAALAALDLREGRGADAGALREIAKRQPHRLPQAP